MTKSILATTATTIAFLGMTLPATADPTIGVGLSIAFGSGKVETGVGIRLFSDNRPQNMVGSVGVDYMFQSKRIRPTVGVAYLGTNGYIGLDMGFGLNGEGIDFGLGVGGVHTKTPVAPVIVPPPRPVLPPPPPASPPAPPPVPPVSSTDAA